MSRKVLDFELEVVCFGNKLRPLISICWALTSCSELHIVSVRHLWNPVLEPLAVQCLDNWLYIKHKYKEYNSDNIIWSGQSLK